MSSSIGLDWVMCNQKRGFNVGNVAVLLSMSSSLRVGNVDAIVWSDERLPKTYQGVRVMRLVVHARV
jgi:hypothetical protein